MTADAAALPAALPVEHAHAADSNAAVLTQGLQAEGRSFVSCNRLLVGTVRLSVQLFQACKIVTLLCQACLGLHSAPVAGLDDSAAAGAVAASTVLCLSATGGIAAAQLLPPAQANVLLEWQQSAVLEAAAAGHIMRWGEISGAVAAGQGSAGATLAASGVVEANLRGLVGPDSTASYEGFDRAQGALATNLAGRLRLQAGMGRLEQGQPKEAGLKPLGAVDGDLLFVGEQGRVAAKHQALRGMLCSRCCGRCALKHAPVPAARTSLEHNGCIHLLCGWLPWQSNCTALIK
jgi:hypothetical protein